MESSSPSRAPDHKRAPRHPLHVCCCEVELAKSHKMNARQERLSWGLA